MMVQAGRLDFEGQFAHTAHTAHAAHAAYATHAVRFVWLLVATALLIGCQSVELPPTPDNSSALSRFLGQSRAPGFEEGVYAGGDGSELGFKGYLADQQDDRVALVYFHGIESHAGWFDQAARLLQRRGLDIFCLDRRGSGINRENRGLPSGHTDSKELLFADIDAFVQPLKAHYQRIVLVGLSWGGKLATAYELEQPGNAAGLVLITPGIRALVDAPVSTKLQILLASFFSPMSQFPTPIEPEMFTTTPRYLDYIQDDPLRLTEASASFFMVSRELDGYVEKNIADNRAPVLLFLAGKDRIIDNPGVVDVLERGGQDSLEIVEYSDQTHSIQFDAPARMVDDMIGWLDSHIITARGS
ncbi:MAG: alpha/beta fold hydrolase [Geminicoccaceae bacterium]